MANVLVTINSRANNSGFASASRALAKLSAIAAAFSPAGLHLAAAAVLVLGSALAGLAAIGGAAFAVIKLGMDGIKRAAATAAPAFSSLKAAVSGALEQSMIPGFAKVSTLLGAITPQMTGLASTIGASFSSMMTTIQGQGTGAIQGIITNAQTFIAGITPGLSALLLGILRFGNAASQVMAQFAPQINAFLTGLGAKLGSITPAQIVSAFNQIRDVASQIAPIFSLIGSALATIAQHAQLMFGLAVALKAVQIAIAAVQLATTLWTAAQWLFNAAMAANPITIIIIAIIALVAIIVLIATKTTWFQTIWSAMCSAAAAAWGFITSAVSAFVGWVTGIWASIVGAASACWSAISSAASACWSAISSVVSTVAGVIGSVISGAIDIVVGVFNTVLSVGQSVWNGIASAVGVVAGAISTVVGWIQTLIGWIANIHWPSPPGWLSAMFNGGPDMPGFGGGAAFMVPTWTLRNPGTVQLAEGFPSLSQLGGAGGGRAVVINNDNRTIVKVDGSGVVDPQRVSRAVTHALGRDDQTRGQGPAVRLG